MGSRSIILAKLGMVLNRLTTSLGEKISSKYSASVTSNVSKDGELAQVRKQVAKKNQRLKGIRIQLAKREEELADLRAKLDQSEGTKQIQNLSGERVPVFFVVGLAKFGTSWLMKTLDSHPEILCKGEGRFFGRDFRSSASFEKSTKSRQRGQEDSSSFFRKGIAGDWKNYFTERDKQIFKEEAGDLLVNLGYEEGYDW